MKNLIGGQAVVVGARLAGLTAARALAAYFERVIVLERDVLPADAGHRKGTPARPTEKFFQEMIACRTFVPCDILMS